MPVYDFDCKVCGIVPDQYAGMAEYVKACPTCGGNMTRLFPSRINCNPDIQPYLDENMGTEPIYITSRRQKRDELKKRKLVEVG